VAIRNTADPLPLGRDRDRATLVERGKGQRMRARSLTCSSRQADDALRAHGCTRIKSPVDVREVHVARPARQAAFE
jgi:hypothetical protein